MRTGLLLIALSIPLAALAEPTVPMSAKRAAAIERSTKQAALLMRQLESEQRRLLNESHRAKILKVERMEDWAHNAKWGAVAALGFALLCAPFFLLAASRRSSAKERERRIKEIATESLLYVEQMAKRKSKAGVPMTSAEKRSLAVKHAEYLARVKEHRVRGAVNWEARIEARLAA